ncbi:MAG: hypothetical protein ACREP6_07015, partial [Candidatus Binataceae bacterium]
KYWMRIAGRVADGAAALMRPAGEHFCRRGFLAKWALMCGAIALAATTSGCWMAAGPAISAVAGLTRAASAEISRSAESARENEALEKTEMCDWSGRQMPLLIELRTDKLGTTIYRPFEIGAPEISPELMALKNEEGTAGGWKLAGNFVTMNFQPSLSSMLVPSTVTYLAYAPADPGSPVEGAELGALKDWGSNFGTFKWKGRVYRYAATHKLPCFPQPGSGKSAAAISKPAIAERANNLSGAH